MAVVTKKKHTRKDKVNEIIRAEDNWEPVGHTPMPELPDLRNWDMRLMKTYKPFYAPMCDLCCFCTYGKCDLTGDKRGLAASISQPSRPGLCCWHAVWVCRLTEGMLVMYFTI